MDIDRHKWKPNRPVATHWPRYIAPTLRGYKKTQHCHQNIKANFQSQRFSARPSRFIFILAPIPLPSHKELVLQLPILLYPSLMPKLYLLTFPGRPFPPLMGATPSNARDMPHLSPRRHPVRGKTARVSRCSPPPTQPRPQSRRRCVPRQSVLPVEDLAHLTTLAHPCRCLQLTR